MQIILPSMLWVGWWCPSHSQQALYYCWWFCQRSHYLSWPWLAVIFWADYDYCKKYHLFGSHPRYEYCALHAQCQCFYPAPAETEVSVQIFAGNTCFVLMIFWISSVRCPLTWFWSILTAHLEALGRPQSPTPIKPDNTTADSFVHANIRKKRLKTWYMYMRYNIG